MMEIKEISRILVKTVGQGETVTVPMEQDEYLNFARVIYPYACPVEFYNKSKFVEITNKDSREHCVHLVLKRISYKKPKGDIDG